MSLKIGDNIKRIRLASNITQTRLAEEAKVTRNLIYKYEKNIVEPSAVVLGRIAQVLDCSYESIYTGRLEFDEIKFDSMVNQLKTLQPSEKKKLAPGISAWLKAYNLEG